MILFCSPRRLEVTGPGSCPPTLDRVRARRCGAPALQSAPILHRRRSPSRGAAPDINVHAQPGSIRLAQEPRRRERGDARSAPQPRWAANCPLEPTAALAVTARACGVCQSARAGGGGTRAFQGPRFPVWQLPNFTTSRHTSSTAATHQIGRCAPCLTSVGAGAARVHALHFRGPHEQSKCDLIRA